MLKRVMRLDVCFACASHVSTRAPNFPLLEENYPQMMILSE